MSERACARFLVIWSVSSPSQDHQSTFKARYDDSRFPCPIAVFLDFPCLVLSACIVCLEESFDAMDHRVDDQLIPLVHASLSLTLPECSTQTADHGLE